MLTKLRRTRKMTYVLWAWCLAILAWAIGGAGSTHCTGTYTQACQAGTGIGVLLVLFVGFVGFCFLALIWFMSRPRHVQVVVEHTAPTA